MTMPVFRFVVTERNANAHLRDVDTPNVQSDEGELIWVQTVTPDQHVRHHSLPTVIKMDIEWAEMEALKKLIISRRSRQAGSEPTDG